MPTREECLQRCEQLRQRLEALGVPEERIEIRYKNCIRKCEGKIDNEPNEDKTIKAPCSGGIKLAPTGSMKAKMSKCPEGWKRVHHEDGYDWCCPPEKNGNGNGNNGDEDKKKDEECPLGLWFTTHEPKCPEGYTFVPRSGKGWEGYEPGAVGRCECTSWLEEWKKKNQQTGEFKWSPELQAALARLLERFNFLMDYPRGTTPEERQKIINFAMKGIKRAERGMRQQTIDDLARMGLLGSFMESKELSKLRRGTQEALADLQSRIAIDELDRRFKELLGTTQLAQSLFTTGMTYEQLLEALNAARRAEGRDIMEIFLKYLASLMGSQSSGYWQTLLNLIASQGQGGGIYDVLPYLIFLLGGGSSPSRKDLITY
ncbi:MAG: hypothetical protein J7L26_12575 [Candidatus Aminicenantes bacterium]|nr:hypothetical protein [Candidatus Aminicenantes bacterium]